MRRGIPIRLLLGLVLVLALGWPGAGEAQIAFGTIGAATNTANVAYPASIAAGDMLVMCNVSKYPTYTIDTPSGWTLAASGTGGAGASGPGTGTVTLQIFYKEATGSESGTLTITASGSPFSSLLSVMARYTRTNTAWGSPLAAANGADSSQDTSWSVTAGTHPDVNTADMVVTCSGGNAMALSSSAGISQTGVTFGTVSERGDAVEFGGDDVSLNLVDIAVTTGPSSAAPVFTATAAASVAGVTAFLVLHETSVGAAVPQSSGWLPAVMP